MAPNQLFYQLLVILAGIRVRRDTPWHQTVSARAWFRFRGRGKSPIPV
jgi:hypothetical protein